MRKSNFFLPGILFCVLCFLNSGLAGQSVGINPTGAEPDSSAILDLQASDKGLLIPRMDSVQRMSISAPATGLILYQTDGTEGFYFYNGASWSLISHSGATDGLPQNPVSGEMVYFDGNNWLSVPPGLPHQNLTFNNGRPEWTWQPWQGISQSGPDLEGEAADDWFGYAVAISADGSRLAVGARFNDGNGMDAGHVQVYEWGGSSWSQLGADIEGETAGDQSGVAIAISADGNRLAIGANLNDDAGMDAGHVRVYEWNDTSWVQIGGDLDGEAPGDWFGFPVALSADGSYLAAGGFFNDDNGTDAGHVRVFHWNGSVWNQLGADIDGEAAGDWSGFSISLSSNGSRLAVGATYNDGSGMDAGHARIFEWNGSAWIQLGADIDGEAAGDESGISVSLSGDGSRLAIGGYLNDDGGNNAGHARVFEWNGTVWLQLGTDIDGEAAEDQFGTPVSLSANGNRLAVGARLNDDNGNNAGQVRVFAWSGTDWVQLDQDLDGEAADDVFGLSIFLSADGSHLAAGGPNNDGNGNNSGNVRVFKITY